MFKIYTIKKRLFSKKIKRAEFFERNGETEKALFSYRNYLRSLDKDGEAWYRLGRILENSGKIDESVRAYRRSVEILGVNCDAAHALAVSGEHLMAESAAFRLFSRKNKVNYSILPLKKIFNSKYLARARFYARKKEWNEASLNYNIYLSRVPEDDRAWVQLGHSLNELGNRHYGQLAYHNSISLAGMNSDAWTVLSSELRNVDKEHNRTENMVSEMDELSECIRGLQAKVLSLSASLDKITCDKNKNAAREDRSDKSIPEEMNLYPDSVSRIYKKILSRASNK